MHATDGIIGDEGRAWGARTNLDGGALTPLQALRQTDPQLHRRE